MKASGGAGMKRAKDGAMAKRMKEEGVTRNVARCPVCHFLISLHHMYNHVALHK